MGVVLDKLWDRGLDLLLSCMLRCKWVTEITLRFVGPFFVVLALTLMLGCIYVFLVSIFPLVIPDPLSFLGVLHLLWCAFLFQGLMFNYTLTIITPPGAPPTPVPHRTIYLLTYLLIYFSLLSSLFIVLFFFYFIFRQLENSSIYATARWETRNKNEIKA